MANDKCRGQFIVIEGLSGVGKSALATRMLEENWFGTKCILLGLSKDNGTDLFQKIYGIISSDPKMDSFAKFSLYAAALSDLSCMVRRMITEDGFYVICDRYLYSVLYHNPDHEITAKNILLPDAVVYLVEFKEIIENNPMVQHALATVGIDKLIVCSARPSAERRWLLHQEILRALFRKPDSLSKNLEYFEPSSLLSEQPDNRLRKEASCRNRKKSSSGCQGRACKIFSCLRGKKPSCPCEPK